MYLHRYGTAGNNDSIIGDKGAFSNTTRHLPAQGVYIVTTNGEQHVLGDRVVRDGLSRSVVHFFYAQLVSSHEKGVAQHIVLGGSVMGSVFWIITVILLAVGNEKQNKKELVGLLVENVFTGWRSRRLS